MQEHEVTQLIQQAGNKGQIGYLQLLQALAPFLHGFNSQIPYGKDQSHFAKKPITPKVRDVLQRIAQNAHNDFRRYFENFFPDRFPVSPQEFSRLLAQQNLMLSQMDENEVISYFRIDTSLGISKIIFVEAMKHFQSQAGYSSFGNVGPQNFGSSMAINQETEDFLTGIANKIIHQQFTLDIILR